MASYFDKCVPSEVLREHLFDFLSDRPRHIFLEAYISATDVLNLLQVSTLRGVLSRKFTTVSTVQKSQDVAGADFDPGTEDTGLLIFDEILFEKLFPQIAESIQTLNIDAELVRGSIWIDALAGAKVKELSVLDMDDEFPLDDVLRACPRLESLTLNHKRAFQDRHFVTITDRVPEIEFLSLTNVRPATQLDDFWPKLGKLQKLSIELEAVPMIAGPLELDAVFNMIPAGCPYLRELDLGEVQLYMFATIIALCTRIGRSLHELELFLDDIPSGIVASGLSDIRNTCPDVKVRLTCRADCFINAMHALGKHAIALQPTQSMFRQVPLGLSAAAATCVNLDSLTLNLLDSWAAEFLECVLSGALGENLEELRLNIYPAYSNVKLADKRSPALETVAKYTKKLIRFVLHKARPNVSLDSIAKANSKLRGVVIIADSEVYDEIEDKLHIAEEWLGSVVKDFLEFCPYLDDLTIKETGSFETIIPSNRRIDCVAEACARARQVPVSVGEFHYER